MEISIEVFTKQKISSYDELIEKEKIYVDIEWVRLKTTYNIKTGGQSAGILSDESKNKISETLKRRYKNGEIIPRPQIGVPNTKIQKDKISETLKTRYKTKKHPTTGVIPWNKGKKGVQIGWNKGLKIGPHSDESNLRRSVAIKKRLEEFGPPNLGKEPWNKGKKGLQPAWNEGLKMEKIQCPHCGKLASIGNLKRWHLDKCKNNNGKEALHI